MDTLRCSKQFLQLGLIVGPFDAPKGTSANVIHIIYMVQKMYFPPSGHFCLLPNPENLVHHPIWALLASLRGQPGQDFKYFQASSLCSIYVWSRRNTKTLSPLLVVVYLPLRSGKGEDVTLQMVNLKPPHYIRSENDTLTPHPHGVGLTTDNSWVTLDI